MNKVINWLLIGLSMTGSCLIYYLHPFVSGVTGFLVGLVSTGLIILAIILFITNLDCTEKGEGKT